LGRSAQFEIPRRRTESVGHRIDFRRLLFSLQFLSASITVGSHSRPVNSTHTFPHKPSRCGDLAITFCMNRQQNCSLSIHSGYHEISSSDKDSHQCYQELGRIQLSFQPRAKLEFSETHMRLPRRQAWSPGVQSYPVA
jgi:hypothetical protein